MSLNKGIKSVLKVFALAAGLAGCASPTEPTLPPRPLTEGEVDQTTDIFGGELNPHIVTVRLDKNNNGAAAEVFDGSTFAVYGSRYYSSDYSKSDDEFLFGMFFHEMTHIWQFQTGYFDHNEDCSEYEFTLSDKSEFSQFCSEQQSSMVETYARRFLKRSPAPSSYVYKNRPGDTDTPQSDYLLQKVIEDRFPWARAARLEMEEKRKTLPSVLPSATLRQPIIIPPNLRY